MHFFKKYFTKEERFALPNDSILKKLGFWLHPVHEPIDPKLLSKFREEWKKQVESCANEYVVPVIKDEEEL